MATTQSKIKEIEDWLTSRPEFIAGIDTKEQSDDFCRKYLTDYNPENQTFTGIRTVNGDNPIKN